MSGVDLIPIETIRSAFHIEDWTQEDDMAEARLLIFDSRSLCLKACFSKLEKKMKLDCLNSTLPWPAEVGNLRDSLGRWLCVLT